jgi:flavin reductase (DIM6/NTAB) family NADH-FMN oxidoreductase RutF
MDLRRTLGAFLTGVTVVTTRDGAGEPRGMTANSFTSVSLDPPLVLICVAKAAGSFEAFSAASGYVVHILSADQIELAKQFASRIPNKFEGVAWRDGRGGAPLIDGVKAWLDCASERVIDAGDHVIILGRVLDHSSESQRPLGFHQGRFATFDPETKLQTESGEHQLISVGWIAESFDERLAVEVTSEGFWRLPTRLTTAARLESQTLDADAGQDLGLLVRVHFLYSMFNRTDPDRLVLLYRATIPDSSGRAHDGIVLVPLSGLQIDRFAERTDRTVVQRYLRERADGAFGFYSGTETKGNVAGLTLPATDLR